MEKMRFTEAQIIGILNEQSQQGQKFQKYTAGMVLTKLTFTIGAASTQT
jgi:hypothetical protein